MTKLIFLKMLSPFEEISMSEYEIKPITKKELPPTRIGMYDKVRADLEKKEKGIYEINVKGKKINNIVTGLKKKLEPKKFRVFTRSKRCFVEVL
jgi:hypothetical protein